MILKILAKNKSYLQLHVLAKIHDFVNMHSGLTDDKQVSFLLYFSFYS